MIEVLSGPRDSVVARVLTGYWPAHWFQDSSEWVVFDPYDWEMIKRHYPELWVDKIRDYSWEENDAISAGPRSQ